VLEPEFNWPVGRALNFLVVVFAGFLELEAAEDGFLPATVTICVRPAGFEPAFRATFLGDFWPVADPAAFTAAAITGVLRPDAAAAATCSLVFARSFRARGAPATSRHGASAEPVPATRPRLGTVGFGSRSARAASRD
jgi:hypothetical protein